MTHIPPMPREPEPDVPEVSPARRLVVRLLWLCEDIFPLTFTAAVLLVAVALAMAMTPLVRLMANPDLLRPVCITGRP